MNFWIRNNALVTSIIKGKLGRGRPQKFYLKQIMLDLSKDSYKELGC